MESVWWWRRPCRTISSAATESTTTTMKNINNKQICQSCCAGHQSQRRKRSSRSCVASSSLSFTSSAMIWIALLLSTAHLTLASASGFFELEVVALQNPQGRLANGQCCGLVAGEETSSSSSTCQRECATHFRLCLKEYQSNVTVSSPCTYGNASSPVLAGNSFTFVEPDKSNARLVIPFSFRWPRSFTLMLEAIDYRNSTRQSGEIERAVYSGILEPSADWHSLTHEGSGANGDLRLTYRVRVQCEPNYYNATCTKFCRPRNDMFGHYECDRNGDKTCMPGWTGATCETAVCKPGCHPINGQCEQPGECRCRWGWKGEFCDQCVPYPGCKHGYCNGNPWQCICETNWGGILCDQDLNYCGTREPCHNGGTCENTKPDEYLCKCPEGFSGTNCEVVDNVCATAPCLHGGTCTVTTTVVTNGISGNTGGGGSFNCTCPPGWTGDTCQINVDECQSSPCLNGATCVDLENGYRCQCTEGWQGDACDQDVDECSMPELCRNSLGCHNTPGNYTCRCVTGFHGRQCQYNVNDCNGHDCLNGATCIDLIGEYHCACRPGFNGHRCEINIDECASRPCANGGECVDLVDGFKCICPLGYTGSQCQTDTDLCHPNPCANGSPCFNTLGLLGGPDYYCLCQSHWQGKNCSRYRPPPPPPPPPSSPSLQAGSCWTSKGAGHCVHGRCVASEDGSTFSCQCDPGYSGQFCTDNVNDCADSPCRNGGTCIDGIDSFHCVCPKGYDGLTCDHNVDDCASSPCRHNGTCVDLVADFVCRCVDGWKGRTCSNRNQHCQDGENPCLNGATCVDDSDPEAGFTCRCSSGWKGSICHLAEHMPCDANPCRNGATCLNTGQSFTCVCKDGYEGQHCQMEQRQTAASTTTSPASCQWSGRLYPDNSSWDDGCNKCQCRSGQAVCTRVWCGPANCLDDPINHVGKSCGPSEICLSAQSGCLRPPCPAYGQCRPLKPGRLLPVPAATASCWPNLTGNRLAPTCARLTLVLDRYRAQPGFSVQSLCGHLRKLAAAQSHLWDNFPGHQQQHTERPSLVILCDLKDHQDDVVQVTISMSETSMELGGSRATAAARVLGNVLTAYYKEGSSMGAVVDVKVETPYADEIELVLDSSAQNHPSSDSSGSSNYVVAIVCAILAGLVVVAGLLLLLLWRLRKRPALHSPSLSANSSMDRTVEKSNNLQNEENLRLQQRRMKTLNVAELVDHPAKGGLGLSKKLGKVDDVVVPHDDSSSDEYGRRDTIESSPIYKAPISVDVRNNIHMAARAGQMMDKELSLKVVVV